MQWKEIKAVVEKASTVVDVAFTHAITAGFCGGAGLLAFFFGHAVLWAMGVGALFALPLSLALGVAIALVGYAWLKPPEEEFIRGVRRITQEEAEAAAKTLVKTGGEFIRVAHLLLPWAARVTHFVLVGASGAGKTVLIRLFLQSVISTFAPGKDRRLLLYDNKSNLLSTLAGMRPKVPIAIVSPFDKRCVFWDIALDVDSPAVSRTVARCLCPVEGGGDNEFWDKAVRSLLAGVFDSFRAHAPGVWKLRDVVLAMQDRKWLRFIVGRHPQTRHLLKYFFEEKMLVSVEATIETRLGDYAPVAALWSHAKKGISLKAWAEGEEFIIVLGNLETPRAGLDPIYQAMVQVTGQRLCDQLPSKTRATFLVLDEARELGKVPILRTLMNKSRENGVSILLGFQDKDGMTDNYGIYVAREIMGQAATLIVGRLLNAETADYCSQAMGAADYNVPKATSGPNGTSYTWTREDRPAVKADEFKSIEPTDEETGLTAFMKTAFVPHGVWKFHLEGPELFGRLLGKKSKKVEDRVMRPESEQELLPWTAEDLRRLNLPDDPDKELEKIVGPALTKRLRLFDKAEGKVEEASLDGLGRMEF